MKRSLLIACAMVSVARAEPAADEYVVQPGDTCLGIAVKILGDRDALDAYHKLNPQLGPLPHDLVPGSVVKLPPRAPTGPDAELTRATGDVKFRRPSTTQWDVASRGMQLFRAWRVGASDRASAELMFRNNSFLGLRERTIVVIYGPEKKLAKVITATADLEEGALEARLGNLDGKPVIVRTPSAETDLQNGEVVVTAQKTGSSIVANHKGAAVAVRGRVAKSTSVTVPQGMGSRVPAGGAPEPPRPLPPVPAWSTAITAYAVVGTATVAVPIAWTAVASAQTYRLVVRDGNGDVVSATPVVAPAHALDIALPPGVYAITVAAIDADGFESAPAKPLAIAVAAGSVIPPGGTQPLAGPIAKVGVGATVVAPAGWSCGGGADPAAPQVVLRAAGPTTIRCTAPDGRAAAPFVVEAAPIVLVTPAASRGDLVLATGESADLVLDIASTGALGDGLVLDASPGLHATVTRRSPTSFLVTIAPSASAMTGTIVLRAGSIELASRTVSIVDGPAPAVHPAPVIAPWSAGVFGGYQLLGVARSPDLGDPPRPGSALANGLYAGVRGGYLPGRFGAELELGLSRPGHADGVETATVFVGKLHGVVGHRAGAMRLALVAGGGIQSVVHANGGSTAETDPVFDWGAMFGAAPRGFSIRLDVRHTLFAASGGGVAQGLELTAGVSVELPR